ncbi:MAG TPA: hypothetical protein VGI79_17005 [Caulobacteraceae bacterium]|jgi:hypothetical protein
MSGIKAIDLLLVTDLFEPKGSPGWVLNFNDQTFAQFFTQELKVSRRYSRRRGLHAPHLDDGFRDGQAHPGLYPTVSGDVGASLVGGDSARRRNTALSM